jgi:large subunit ribosomal protein L22
LEVIARARLRYLGTSAQKTRLVVDQVRGKKVEEALSILRYSPKLVSKRLEKLLQSAVANAEQKDSKVDVDELVVSRAVVDEAPPLKRIQHRSMGRVYRILKRTCHVTIDLDLAGAGRKEQPEKGGR